MITAKVSDDGPSVSSKPNNAEHNIRTIARAVLKAKRIAVVCGAGISVASGIPAFRTQGGLFETLKKEHPEAKLSSGKDLFDASLFVSERNTALYYTMIACLAQMSREAKPTAFHRFLKRLDDEGKLMRVYTQNIDGLEQRAGLSYGLGDTNPTTTPQSNGKTKKRKRAAAAADAPRCIPLHGQLATMSCTSCELTIELEPHLATLKSGSTIACPNCSKAEEARVAAGTRRRGIGFMKPDVVLYGEQHPRGEHVGEITRSDLLGKRPDLLIVVGTSLKVPGTKKLVKELAKVIKPHWIYEDGPEEDESGGDEDGDETIKAESTPTPVASQASTSSTMSTASTSTKSRRAAAPKLDKLHAIYLAMEFPTSGKEWEETFDAFVQGDVQEFVSIVQDEERAIEREALKRAEDKKRRDDRKKAAALSGGPLAGPGKKKKAQSVADSFAASKPLLVINSPKKS